MSFGAVDFIIDKKDNIYFIEINSCPGFTTLSNGIYINAVNKLMKLPVNIAKSFGYK
jgi:D-alanine-D-alanine ligase-like ATP-grasp enzyme